MKKTKNSVFFLCLILSIVSLAIDVNALPTCQIFGPTFYEVAQPFTVTWVSSFTGSNPKLESLGWSGPIDCFQNVPGDTPNCKENFLGQGELPASGSWQWLVLTATDPPSSVQIRATDSTGSVICDEHTVVGLPNTGQVQITEIGAPGATLKNLDMSITGPVCDDPFATDFCGVKSASPSVWEDVNPGTHGAYISDLDSFIETVAVCAYPIDGALCQVTDSEFDDPNEGCDGTSCRHTILVSKGEVTRVVYKYNQFTITASPDSALFDQMDAFTVSWTAPIGIISKPFDWVGLYKANDPNADVPILIDWQWSDGTSDGGTGGITENTLTFNAPNELGDYEFRYLSIGIIGATPEGVPLYESFGTSNTVEVSLGEIPAPVVNDEDTFCSNSDSKATISWDEAGRGSQGYFIDVDEDNNFSNGFWNKFVPFGELTIITPDGFSAFGGASGPLTLIGGNTYNARIYYVATGEHSPTSIFTAETCEVQVCAAPAFVQVFDAGPGLVNFEWAAVANVDHYNIRLHDFTDTTSQITTGLGASTCTPHYLCDNGIPSSITSIQNIPVVAGHTYRFWVDPVYIPAREYCNEGVSFIAPNGVDAGIPEPSIDTACSGTNSIATIDWQEGGNGKDNGGWVVDIDDDINFINFWNKFIPPTGATVTAAPDGFVSWPDASLGTLNALAQGATYYVRVFYPASGQFGEHSGIKPFTAATCASAPPPPPPSPAPPPSPLPNQAPSANSQSVSTDEDTAVSVTLTGSDPEGSSLSFAIISGPNSGSLSGSGASITYIPNPNFNGADSFIFKANDGNLDSGGASVSITVNPVNDPPVAMDTASNTDEDNQVIVTLSYSDNIDNDIATSCSVTNVAGGSVTQSCSCSSGVCTVGLIPSQDSNSDITADYTVNDGANSNTAHITVTVNPVNDAPAFSIPSPSINEDDGFVDDVIDLDSFVTDVDDPVSSLTYFGFEQTDKTIVDCNLDPSGRRIDCTTVPDQFGTSDITVQVQDPQGATDSITFTLTVSGVNDDPGVQIIEPQSTFVENQAFNVIANAMDIDSTLTAITYTIDFGDGTAPATGNVGSDGSIGVSPQITHSYAKTGIYTLTIIVDDGDGGTASDSVAVTVLPFTVEITSDKTTEKFPFDIKFGVIFNGGAFPYQVEWDFNGDGIFEVINNTNPTAKFKDEGKFNVLLKVTDNDGDIATDTVLITSERETMPRKVVHISSIGYESEYVRPGDDLNMLLNFRNNGNSDLNDARITAIIPELGVRSRTLKATLNKNDDASKFITIEIPDNTPKGRYWVMLMIDIDGDRRIKYRPVDVI